MTNKAHTALERFAHGPATYNYCRICGRQPKTAEWAASLQAWPFALQDGLRRWLDGIAQQAGIDAQQRAALQAELQLVFEREAP